MAAFSLSWAERRSGRRFSSVDGRPIGMFDDVAMAAIVSARVMIEPGYSPISKDSAFSVMPMRASRFGTIAAAVAYSTFVCW